MAGTSACAIVWTQRYNQAVGPRALLQRVQTIFLPGLLLLGDLANSEKVDYGKRLHFFTAQNPKAQGRGGRERPPVRCQVL